MRGYRFSVDIWAFKTMASLQKSNCSIPRNIYKSLKKCNYLYSTKRQVVKELCKTLVVFDMLLAYENPLGHAILNFFKHSHVMLQTRISKSPFLHVAMDLNLKSSRLRRMDICVCYFNLLTHAVSCYSSMSACLNDILLTYNNPKR